MSTKKKKRKGRINVSMGDTVKLSKGRIGLVRFIGKTQFSLGEWIGIELYNVLIRTRHNGAVLGKRYFRCPPHRGVFVRRGLIKENIAVLDIQKSINKLRAKEKKLKDQRKKKLKKEKESKKIKNEEKRKSKQLKLQAKYGVNSPKITEKILTPKDDKKTKPITKELPASFANYNTRNKKRNSLNDSDKKDVKKRADKNVKKKGKNKRKSRSNSSNSKKRNSNSNSVSVKETNGNVIEKQNENDSENDDFPPIDINEFVTAEPLMIKKYISKKIKNSKTRTKKSGSVESNITKKNGKKRNSTSSNGSGNNTPNKRPVLKSSVSSPHTPIYSGKDDEKDDEKSVSYSGTRNSLSRSVGDDMPENSMSMKSKVSVHSYDGVLVSDDDSLNDEEENEEENEDSVLMKELEEDFEKNYDIDEIHKVVDVYTHTIDDIEDGRKRLANKIVMETKKRKSKSKKRGGSDLERYKEMRNKVVSEHKRKNINKIDRRINPNLMMATMRNKKNKKTFDSARSRRGSSFVDDYNLNDTLFFDGDEETDTVKDGDEQFYVDDMGSDDEDNTNNTMNTIQEEKKEDRIVEGAEEYEDDMTETETELDPLLGTIDDDETEYEEEELKIFDIEKDEEYEKIIVFYVELCEFLEWESNDNGYGMKIIKLNNNEYGDALVNETNINNEWNICVINNNNIQEMMKGYITKTIKKCNETMEKGYSLTFRKEKNDNINAKINLKPSVYMKSRKKTND